MDVFTFGSNLLESDEWISVQLEYKITREMFPQFQEPKFRLATLEYTIKEEDGKDNYHFFDIH